MLCGDRAALRRLEKHLDFLSQLSKAKRKERRLKLLSIATPEQIHTVCECIKNILQGVFEPKFNTQTKRYLRQFEPVYDTITKKNRIVPLAAKRRLLIQKGGFLLTLLAPIIGLAGSLLSNLL